ncbi:hypothetical protein ACOSQ2_014859 [Xanthoceras sorbifolium]
MASPLKFTEINGFRGPPLFDFFYLASLVEVTVSSLFSANRVWNSPLIDAHFLPDDAKFILSLPPPSPSWRDSFCWSFDNNDFYSVKSGYCVALAHSLNLCSLSFSGLEEWWKFC